MTILSEWQAWEEPSEAPPPLALRIAGHALSAIATIGLIPAAVSVGVGGMMFDSPGSESNPYVWMLAALLWAAPVVMILVRSKAREAALTGRWSTFWLTLALLILYGGCFGVVDVLLDRFCDGDFSCR